MADKESSNEGKPFDPMEPWRGVRDAYLDAWSKTMIEMVNNEAYAQATGTMLNTSLTVSAPFREALEKSMLKALEQLAMPSRADFVSIASRLTNIEMRLDDLDAKLDTIKLAAKTAAPAERARAESGPAESGTAAARKAPEHEKSAGRAKQASKMKRGK